MQGLPCTFLCSTGNSGSSRVFGAFFTSCVIFMSESLKVEVMNNGSNICTMWCLLNYTDVNWKVLSARAHYLEIWVGKMYCKESSEVRSRRCRWRHRVDLQSHLKFISSGSRAPGLTLLKLVKINMAAARGRKFRESLGPPSTNFCIHYC